MLKRLARGVLWGFILWGAGFLLGFLVPMILDPDSAAGPMFGVLITGPLAALAGFLAGVLWPTPPGPEHPDHEDPLP